MARTKGATNKKLKLYKGVGKSLRYMRATGRRMMFNPQPVFTESYALMNGEVLYAMNPGSGGVLAVNMSQIPQLAQYSNLYQKYRILKAKFICIPTWSTESSDPQVAATIGLSRIVYAINNSPAIAAPASEAVVLQDNGCRILCGKPKITMSCRPVPNTLDTNGIQTTLNKKYINFNTVAANNTPHYGISWYHSQPGTAGPTGATGATGPGADAIPVSLFLGGM